MRAPRSKLQYVADAAAMGSARSLNGTSTGITNARSQAQRIASVNTVAGQAFSLTQRTGTS